MINHQTLIQKIQLTENVFIDILRLDLIDSEISGNKWFKLKYNIQKAKQLKHQCILTFGGAHSNHIAATAKACKDANLNSIGVIRGDLSQTESPTLVRAKENGMQICLVSREDYRKKEDPTFFDRLQKKFGDFYILPEGGNNKEGILGCMEILKPEWTYDYIFCACGTGATYAGLLASANANQMVVGINVLKGNNTMPKEVVKKLLEIDQTFTFNIYGNEKQNESIIDQHCILNTYAFSGYAKHDPPLVEFKQTFENKNGFLLDYVYTNKLFFAVNDLIQQKKINTSSNILVIHTGGLQGNVAFERRFLKSD